MKTPKKSLAALLAMTLTVGLTACSGETDSQSAQSASSQPAQSASSSHTQEESGFPFTLTTKDGQEVTFTHVPETIISCNPNAGDELMALGLGDKIIATAYNNPQVNPQWREEYEAIPTVAESYISLETIHSLEPDFVYGRSSSFSEKNNTTHDTLSGYGIMSLSSIEGYTVGAVLAMLVGVWLPMGRLSVPAGAFVGALVSILLVYGLSRSGGAVTPVRLILVGVAVSAMFQAFTNYLVYTAPDDAAVREATFWMLGGLGSAKWEDLPLLALILPPLFLVLMALARPLNAMLMGDSSAVTLGVDLDRVRGVLILSSALLTASAVAVSGCIGFVGLVIPHLVRSVVGADHRRLIPLSALCGAVFMIWMDVGARLAVRPEEIPVGIITAFIGAPLFLWMIRVRRYEF